MIREVSRRYEEYKGTDSLWYEKTPIHWVSGRIKDFVDADTSVQIPMKLDENSLVEFIPMANVDDELGKVKEFNFVPLKEVASGYTKFKNGDVIFAKITPCMENGNCAIVSGLKHNICFGSTEFMVFRAYQKLTDKYLHYFLHNELFRRNAEPFMKGTAGQKRIGSHYMATHFFSLPPLPEQKSIANYLDTKTAKIDKKIDLLTQKAAHYAKLKQALINETVTRGLDKSVPMKDSGIEWIGEVPEHWKTKRIKEISYINRDVLSEKTPPNYEFDYIDIGSVTYGTKGYVKERVTYNTAPSRAKRIVKKGDTIVSTVRTYLKAIATIEEDASNLIVSTGFAVISPKKILINKYCSYLLISESLINGICFLSKGVSYPATNATEIGNLLFLIPPLPEQKAIADYLDTKTAKIDTLIETINNQIEQLKELRKTLINDVVTGQIKVI